jgi:hypothetical protein
MNNNNRFLVMIVIALAVLLGVVGVSGISYREGFSDGARTVPAPQYVYPPDDAPRAVPAPAQPAPGYYTQPYYGRSWGMGGGFNPLGFIFNILLISFILFIVSRLFFRWRFGGRGPWGRGGWGGPGRGAWGHGRWGEWPHKDEDAPRPDAQKRRDDEVI